MVVLGRGGGGTAIFLAAPTIKNGCADKRQTCFIHNNPPQHTELSRTLCVLFARLSVVWSVLRISVRRVPNVLRFTKPMLVLGENGNLIHI